MTAQADRGPGLVAMLCAMLFGFVMGVVYASLMGWVL